jgi:hypothetical protein
VEGRGVGIIGAPRHQRRAMLLASEVMLLAEGGFRLRLGDRLLIERW